MVERWTVSIPEDLADQVEAELRYGDNRSKWVVDAIERKLDAEGSEPVRDEPDPEPVGVELPDDVPQTVDRDAARAAIQAVLQFLESEGSASQREIVSAVMPKHPLGYDVPELEQGERFRGSWWRRVVKPTLKAHNDIESPGQSGTEWRWVG